MPRAFSDFSLGGIPLAPRSVLVLQGLAGHDVATVVVPNAQLPARIPDSLAVELHWGYSTGAEQPFFGYVHHVEPVIDDARVQRTKIVCIGATFPLRQNIRKTWAHQSADVIVRDVASMFYLSALTEPHPVIWPFMSCAGPAWQFLVELAEKIGYLLAGNQTELRFMSTFAAAGRSVSGAPRLVLGEDLQEFRPVVGASIGSEQTIRVAHGVDPRTGSLFTARATPTTLLAPTGQQVAFSTSETGVVAETPGAALDVLTGLQERHRFAFEATAEARGDVNVVQGVVVYLAGVGEDYAGYWMVTQVEHVIRGDEYTMFLELGRDARGAFAIPPMSAISTRRRTDPYGDIAVTSPPTRFLSGNWRSGWARRAV